MPKNLDDKKPKMFYTRVVYNSKFKAVNKMKADEKIRKNTQHLGKNKRGKGETIGKVGKVQEPPKQKCNMVQGVCYNVPVINRFDSLDIQDYLPIDIYDNVLDNVRVNVPKQAQVIHSDDNIHAKHVKNGEKQLQRKVKGKVGKYVDTDDNRDVRNHLVTNTFDKNVENKSTTKTATVQSSDLQLGKRLTANCPSSRTEPNLCREVPWQDVQPEILVSPDLAPVWDCKLAKQMKLWEAATVPDFQKWKIQNKFAFGFIPLSPLVGEKQWKEKCKVQSPIEAYHIVKNSGFYNHQQARILLESQLNSIMWEEYLQDYWDWQLVQYIKFGFPLDVAPHAELFCDFSNHKSATLFPSHVNTYLQEEKGFKAIYGPFNEKPFERLHCSPFITREKPDSENRRVIVDLSWPKGNSVNDFVNSDEYMGTKFMLTFPSIDDITAQIIRLGHGCLLYKVDISRAFRHIKVDPSEYDKLGLNWEGFYFDSCLPFGFKHGSKIFQRTSDAVKYIMSNQNYDIINYIDDLIGFGLPSTVHNSYKYLCELLEKLGLTISSKKLFPPSTVVTCLGVQIDTVKGTISVPPEKLKKIMHICFTWESKKTVRKRDLQSLLGSLMHITKCVRSSRPFLNRMLQNLREAKTDYVYLNPDFYRDLLWFQTFLPHFNGVCVYNHPLLQGTVQVDASLQGLGGRWGDCVYKLSIPLGMDDLGIVQLEMLNLFLALRIWAPNWAGKRVRFECDNQAVVAVMKAGKTRDPVLAAYARNIHMLASVFDIEITVIHLPGVKNTVADLLSRWDTISDSMIQLKKHIEKPQWVPVHLEMLHIDWTI